MNVPASKPKRRTNVLLSECLKAVLATLAAVMAYYTGNHCGFRARIVALSDKYAERALASHECTLGLLEREGDVPESPEKRLPEVRQMTSKMSNERREDGFKARFAVESGSNPAVALFAFMTACGILAVSHWLYVEISELSGMSLTLVSALDAIGLAVIAVSFILPVAGIARNHLGNRTRRCRRMELHVKNGNLRSSGR